MPFLQPAPSERLSHADVVEQHDFLSRCFDARIVDTIHEIVMILNTNRQIVYANKVLIDLLQVKGLDNILGIRPGELFKCVHSKIGPGGCGTSTACAQCGTLRAVLGASSGLINEQEGRVLVRSGGVLKALTVNVRAVPVPIEGRDFVIVYMQDIQDTKTREMMEKAFLHDALNALNGLVGAASLLHDETVGEARELSAIILERASHLEREIRGQRILRAAEDASLEVLIEQIEPKTVCTRIAKIFNGNCEFEGSTIVCEIDSESPTIWADKRLLYRVMENMLKNALEASPQNGTIRIGYTVQPQSVTFHIANQGCIPPEVKDQIFQRSFSTKGKGRGLGTYCIKMITENYLHGSVNFVSDRQSGTVFHITIPVAFPQDEPALAASGEAFP